MDIVNIGRGKRLMEQMPKKILIIVGPESLQGYSSGLGQATRRTELDSRRSKTPFLQQRESRYA